MLRKSDAAKLRVTFIVILPCKYTGLYMSVYQNRTACPRFASRL